jgi:hypothetical protein
MILKKELTYLGYKDSLFLFEMTPSGRIHFAKCRKELISEFSLLTNQMIGTTFNVSYFESLLGEREMNIITDLKIN